jgi:hypothetical protein
VTEQLHCPTCADALVDEGEDGFRCPEDHRYTVVGLALTTNIAALRALWMAIRALEDDAHGLRYMAKHYGDTFGRGAELRLDEAAAALKAAEILRKQAHRAQARLDALPAAPSSLDIDGIR